jgi:hypothetical protein
MADDAIGGPCAGKEVAVVGREIDGNAQQADADQGKKQAQQYLPDAGRGVISHGLSQCSSVKEDGEDNKKPGYVVMLFI